MSMCKTVEKCTLTSPIGDLELLLCSNGVHALTFVNRGNFNGRLLKTSVGIKGTRAEVCQLGVVNTTIEWLKHFFISSATTAASPVLPPLCVLKLISAADHIETKGHFRHSVWKTLVDHVSFGDTVSYGQLAKLSGYPRASRAVGSAMNRNPVVLLIPCHRVIQSNGKNGNYGGGADLKSLLLKHEQDWREHKPINSIGNSDAHSWLKNESFDQGDIPSNREASNYKRDLVKNKAINEIDNVGPPRSSKAIDEIDDVRPPSCSNALYDSGMVETYMHAKKSKKSGHKHHKHKDKKKSKRDSHHRCSSSTNKSRGSRSSDDICETFKSDIVTEVKVAPRGKVFMQHLSDIKTPLAYRIDRTADRDNFSCGELYRLHVAHFKRLCLRNKCLGFPSYNNDIRSVPVDRYFSVKAGQLKSGTASGPRKGFAKSASGERFYVKEFGKKFAPSYIPLHLDTVGGDLGHQNADPSFSAAQSMPQSMFRQKVAEYNRKLALDPNSVDTWLEFAAYQSVESNDDDSLLKGLSAERTAAATAEIRSSILDRAIQNNPLSVRLKLAQLETCDRIWDIEKMTNEWKKLIFAHPNDPSVWSLYLRYLRSTFSTFSASRLQLAYVRAVSTLRALRDGTMVTHKAMPHIAEHLIDIFMEYCVFLSGAGHYEKAIALFQAQMEFSFCRPAILGPQTSHKDAVDFMSVFWDSSAPKFGETAAAGWSAWVEGGGVHSSSSFWYSKEDDENTEQSMVAQHSNRSDSWVSMEVSRGRRHWLPWRPDFDKGEASVEECEDPERVILFDDISDALFFVSSEASRYRLIDAFLKFLVCEKADVGSKFLEWGVLLENVQYSTENCGFVLKLPEICRELWQRGSDVFETSSSNLTFTGELSSEVIPNRLNEFVCNIFEQCIPLLGGDFRTLLTLRYISFKMALFLNQKVGSTKQEIKHAVKELRKFFKSLLKLEHNRSCLPVWECYALFEWEAGNTDEARKVFETALSMAGSDMTRSRIDEQSSCVTMNLYSSYVCLEFGFNKSFIRRIPSGYSGRMRSQNVQQPNIGRCLRILMMICDGKHIALSGETAESCVLPPSAQVRARHVYQQRFDELLAKFIDAANSSSVSAAPIGSLLLDWTMCYTVFLFLTVNLSSAVQPFQNVIGRIQSMLERGASSSGDCSSEHIKRRSTLNTNVFLHTVDASSSRSRSKLLNPMLAPDLTFADFCTNFFIKHCMKSYIGFLHHHLLIVATPLKVLREPLFCALQHFPDDPQLLDVFVDVETAGCAIGGVREYFHMTLNQAITPVPFIYAILSERKRMCKLSSSCQIFGQRSSLSEATETGVTHQLRSWFERAVNHEASRRCPLIWRMYMLFEAEMQSPERVKAVFYRSLQFCPWAKSLYTDCVHLVKNMLQEVTDLMTEKEIRLRVPLEELDLLLSASKPMEMNHDGDLDDISLPIESV